MFQSNKRSYQNTCLLPLLLLGSTLVAHADTMFIQTDAATGGIFVDTSRIQVAGTNDTPTLTLDAAPIISDLYTFLLQPFSGTKTSSSTTIFDHVAIVQDNSITVFNGLFLFSQPVTETVTGGIATFAALQGPQVTLALTNGRFLKITPLANPDIGANPVVKANFQLSSTGVPEPSSFLFVSAGLAGLAAIVRRRRMS
jgi:hypothetical protein